MLTGDRKAAIKKLKKIFVHLKDCYKFAPAFTDEHPKKLGLLAYGVIGNTADFGSVVQGSSPCRPTKKS